MHVLWTPSWYPTPDQPFNGSFFAEQVAMLRDAGLTVGVICINPTTVWKHRPGSLRIDAEDQSIYCDMPTVPHGIIPGDGALIRHWAIKLAKLYEDRWGIPDIIHAHSVFPGILLAQVLAEHWSIPYGITEHRPSTLHRNRDSFRFQMIKRATCGADFFNAVSQPFAEKLSRYYGCAHVHATDLPVPNRFFHRSLTAGRTTGFTFIHVSHLDRNKRVEETISAFNQVYRKYRDTRLIIIGGSSERIAELQRYTKDLECRQAVEFRGQVTREMMPQEMRRGDCLVLFSAREAGGTVFAEAQSLGLTCIASATYGGLHMISPPTGTIVPIDDIAALAHAMENLVQEVKAGKQIDQENIRKIAHNRFSESAFAEHHRQMYDSVLGRQSRRGEVLVVSRIHSPEVSAASFRLNAVENALAQRVRNLKVITARLPQGTSYPPDRFWVRRVPVIRDHEGYVRGYIPYLSFDIGAFARVLSSRAPDVALVEPPPTTGVMMRVASRLKRFPYIWYAPDVWSDATESMNAPRIVTRAVRLMESWAIKGAAGVVAVSQGVAERVQALGGNPIAVCPNGADMTIFHPDGDTVSHSTLEEAGVIHPYFIYAGTASEWQGAEIFVEAFRKVLDAHPKTQIVFLSRGASVPTIRTLADTLEREVGATFKPIIVLEPVAPEQAAQWQRGAIAALVSIVPGQGYDFAYPTKVLTALACGSPVLYAGPGPAGADINEHNLGLTVDYDSDSIAQAMIHMRSAGSDHWSSQRLAQWVSAHRSMEKMGRDVADFVVKAMKGNISS